MLTRLKVNGFKNLVDLDVSFGPFTCIAGANGVGKSNLFDAIAFLGALSEKPLMEAALSVRSEGGRAADLRNIFHRVGDQTTEEMTLEAEMLIPSSGVDDLGQEAKAAITFLRYLLRLGLGPSGLSIRHEELTHITQGDAKNHLAFTHSFAWRRSVVQGRRGSPLISTELREGTTYIKLHQDLGKDYKGGGRPRNHVAEKLPRTVLSNVNAAESATAVLARREMQSWRLLQLEPSALRAADLFTAPRSIATNGAHLPATLARLAKLDINPASGRVSARPSHAAVDQTEALYARVANRLAELIEGVGSVRVDVDERRELLTVLLRDHSGTEHEARSLSDGTLRFLALAILESDADARGVLCLEEPGTAFILSGSPPFCVCSRILPSTPWSRSMATTPFGKSSSIRIRRWSPARFPINPFWWCFPRPCGKGGSSLPCRCSDGSLGLGENGLSPRFRPCLSDD